MKGINISYLLLIGCILVSSYMTLNHQDEKHHSFLKILVILNPNILDMTPEVVMLTLNGNLG